MAARTAYSERLHAARHLARSEYGALAHRYSGTGPLEKRIYQQILWRSINGRAKFLQRIRNEQRWHEVLDPDGSVNRVRFSNRVRFLFSVSLRVFEDEKKPRLVLADEALFHFGNEIIYNTFDQNAVIGPHHEVENFIFSNGFSGHGLQQSPAMGRGMSELLIYGKYRELDLSSFSYDRIINNEPFFEEAII